MTLYEISQKVDQYDDDDNRSHIKQVGQVSYQKESESVAAALSTNICCEIARCLDRIHIVVLCLSKTHSCEKRIII